MFGKRFEIFKLFGFAVRLDASWFLIVVLIAWSLATGIFPAAYPSLGTLAYWLMGTAGAVGLFAAVVLHEFAHSLVARRNGLPMEGITLFLFGGVAEMSEEPPSAGVEFKVAIAGPLTSIALGMACYALVGASLSLSWPEEIVGVLKYLAEINIIVALFNLLPAFPLDGGRVLRSILWRAKGKLGWATRIASQVGTGFATAMILLAVVIVLLGNLLGGVWMFLIGLFLRNAAQMSYRQVELRRALEGETVRRFMHAAPVVVPRSTSVRQLVDEYVYRYHHKMYPVVEGERLVGCVTTDAVRHLSRDEWDSNTVTAVMSPCDEHNTIGPDDDAMHALSRMRQEGTTRLLVVEQGPHLLGILTMKDLLEFFALKVELEPEERSAA